VGRAGGGWGGRRGKREGQGGASADHRPTPRAAAQSKQCGQEPRTWSTVWGTVTAAFTAAPTMATTHASMAHVSTLMRDLAAG
jgi:hypothetical protein